MRLIVSYSCGDSYSAMWTANVPFEYESAEQLLVDIEVQAAIVLENIRKSVYAESPTIRAGDTELTISDFISGGKYWAPSVVSVDQWFEENGLS